jgi:hypothetical protein
LPNQPLCFVSIAEFIRNATDYRHDWRMVGLNGFCCT